MRYVIIPINPGDPFATELVVMIGNVLARQAQDTEQLADARAFHEWIVMHALTAKPLPTAFAHRLVSPDLASDANILLHEFTANQLEPQEGEFVVTIDQLLDMLDESTQRTLLVREQCERLSMIAARETERCHDQAAIDRAAGEGMHGD